MEYVLSIGADVIGTHKRVSTFPFHFGDPEKTKPGQVYVHEYGAKSLYSATKNVSGRTLTAIAYRGGTGSIATIITSIPSLAPTNWVYKPQRRHTIVASSVDEHDESIVRNYIASKTFSMTVAQGGARLAHCSHRWSHVHKHSRSLCTEGVQGHELW